MLQACSSLGGRNNASGYLWKEEMQSDVDDCEEVDEDVPVEDLDKLFNKCSDSNFEGF